MNIPHNLKSTWRNSYREAMEEIKHLLRRPKSDENEDSKRFYTLVRWLMRTKHNPFSFCPHEWAGYKHDPFALAGFLHYLHHAMVDDGDISFVRMMEGKRLVMAFFVFKHKHDEDFRTYCLKSSLTATYIRAAIDASTFMQDINGKEPYTEDSFQFVAHDDPAQFCKDVDTLDRNWKRKMREMEKWKESEK